MSKQIPAGPKDMTCPLHRRAMSKVCQTCPWWVQVRGENPNTGAPVDEWNCAIAWGPMLAINVAQQARQGAAATESFRDEMVERADCQPQAQARQLRPGGAPLIENR